MMKQINIPYIISAFLMHNTWFSKFIPDKIYLEVIYYGYIGRKLNLESPRGFNEKLQWLKLYDHNPQYTAMVDKYEAKKYVENLIGKEHIIKTFGVWDNFDDINFDQLPEQFVLKCTHDSGGLVICKDKDKFDKNGAKKKINNSLKKNFFYKGREWPYKNVKPRIIAEQYIEDSTIGELRDYKFFCFNGVPKCFKVDFDRFTDHHANYFTIEGENLQIGEKICPPVPEKKLCLPQNLSEMRDFAELLAENIPFLRVDFYEVDGKTYFGELTFFPSSGLGRFSYSENDNLLGSWIKLQEK